MEITVSEPAFRIPNLLQIVKVWIKKAEPFLIIALDIAMVC